MTVRKSARLTDKTNFLKGMYSNYYSCLAIFRCKTL